MTGTGGGPWSRGRGGGIAGGQAEGGVAVKTGGRVLREGQRQHWGQWRRVGQGKFGGHRHRQRKTEARRRCEVQMRAWRGRGQWGLGGGWHGCGWIHGGAEGTQRWGHDCDRGDVGTATVAWRP